MLTVGDDMFKYETTTLTRDYWRYTFAGMALQGVVVAKSDWYVPVDDLAKRAAKVADALLLELEKQAGQ